MHEPMPTSDIDARVEIDFPVSFRDTTLRFFCSSHSDFGENAVQRVFRIGADGKIQMEIFYDPDARFLKWNDYFRFKTDAVAVLFRMMM
jgi:hypothetical protein